MKKICDDVTFDLGQEHYIDLLKNSPNKYFQQLSEALFENLGLTYIIIILYRRLFFLKIMKSFGKNIMKFMMMEGG